MSKLRYILERIEAKKADYDIYGFTKTENNAFKTFFDLAQELDSIKDLHYLCVAIPKGFFNKDARLYLIDPKNGHISFTASTDSNGGGPSSPPEGVEPSRKPKITSSGSLFLTIYGKKTSSDQLHLPFETVEAALGMLEVFPATGLDEHRILFFEKFANRIGFNLHNRYLTEKNIEHLRFIRSLVADIEHNIIAPNMVYRLFLRNLKAKILKNIELENDIEEAACGNRVEVSDLKEFGERMKETNDEILEEYENLNKHYRNMSLFLETLLRKSHFDKGQLTLRTKSCNMKRDIVLPQIERFADRFKNLGIELNDRFSGIPDEETVSVVDIGLIAQVYANLFSNALKYTEAVDTEDGRRVKYASYGFETLRDYFGPGKNGLKYNVFTTGRHIPQDERDKIFEEEYRGSNAEGKPGTGHGTAFIKNTIELHGGVVGYEPTHLGNNFYFILPQ